MARPAAGSKRQRPDNRGHLRASAQCPLQVGQAYSSASEVSAATRSRRLHDEAGCRRAQEKRRAVPAHVVGCSLGRSESPRCKVLSRQLDANVAAGGTMFAYMFSHEAHHRGQILMLAHQVGYRVLDKTPGIWQWEKLWKQAGLITRPR